MGIGEQARSRQPQGHQDGLVLKKTAGVGGKLLKAILDRILEEPLNCMPWETSLELGCTEEARKQYTASLCPRDSSGVKEMERAMESFYHLPGSRVCSLSPG